MLPEEEHAESDEFRSHAGRSMARLGFELIEGPTEGEPTESDLVMDSPHIRLSTTRAPPPPSR